MADVSFDYALPSTDFARLGTPEGQWTFQEGLPSDEIKIQGKLVGVSDEVLAILTQAAQEKQLVRLRVNPEVIDAVGILQGILSTPRRVDGGLVTFEMWATPEQS